MNEKEYDQLLSKAGAGSVITVSELQNLTPRTLIFGYELDGNYFHVYLGDDGKIHRFFYKPVTFNEDVKDGQTVKHLAVGHSADIDGGVASNSEFIPSKRANPESCDYEFCELLLRRGLSIPFTTMFIASDEARKTANEGFAGARFESAAVAPAADVFSAINYGLALPSDSAELGVNLVVAAAKKLQVPFAVNAQDLKKVANVRVYVAQDDFDAVKAKVREYFDAMDGDSDTTIANEIVEQFFEGTEESFDVMPYAAGEMRIQYTYNPGEMRLLRTAPVTRYRGPAYGYCEYAVSGEHRGRPFLITFHEEETTNVWYSRFGETDGFVEHYLKRFNLTPEPNA